MINQIVEEANQIANDMHFDVLLKVFKEIENGRISFENNEDLAKFKDILSKYTNLNLQCHKIKKILRDEYNIHISNVQNHENYRFTYGMESMFVKDNDSEVKYISKFREIKRNIVSLREEFYSLKEKFNK